MFRFFMFFLDLCMDYIVIKNVKWEKGEIIYLDSVWNKKNVNLGVLNESYRVYLIIDLLIFYFFSLLKIIVYYFMKLV